MSLAPAASANAVRPKLALHGAIVPLLAAAVFLNYVDRGNLATAAPLMQGELKLSGTQLGLLMSAFFWSYVPAQILAGMLAERINAYRTLAIGVALWSVATALTGVAGGFSALLALRLLLGLGESATFPCFAKIVAENVPAHRLGATNGITLMGLGIGPAFGTFAGGLLIAYAGWRLVFVLLGVATVVWVIPWLMATRHVTAREKAAPAPPSSPSFGAVLRRREFWGSALGHFAGLYAFYFVLSWLPLYLVRDRGLSLTSMAQLGGLIYLVYAGCIFVTGVVSDRLIAAGYGTNLVRKAGILSGLAIAAASLMAAAFGGPVVSVVSLFCAGIAFGLGGPNVYTIPQTLAGPLATGKWVAAQNCLGNFGGILAPVITGMVIDRTGQFFWAFVVAAGVALLGMIGWGILIPEVAPLRWGESKEAVLF